MSKLMLIQVKGRGMGIKIHWRNHAYATCPYGVVLTITIRIEFARRAQFRLAFKPYDLGQLQFPGALWLENTWGSTGRPSYIEESPWDSLWLIGPPLQRITQALMVVCLHSSGSICNLRALLEVERHGGMHLWFSRRLFWVHIKHWHATFVRPVPEPRRFYRRHMFPALPLLPQLRDKPRARQGP